jgi:hypothetical protein
MLAMVKDKRSYCNSDYVPGSDRAQRLEEQKENEWVTFSSNDVNTRAMTSVVVVLPPDFDFELVS